MVANFKKRKQGDRMKKSRGRRLVILLFLAFFATSCASIDVANRESVVAKRSEPIGVVAKEVPVEKIVHRDKEIRRFVIGHYKIDVSEIRGKTRDDLDKIIQELKSLGIGTGISIRIVVIGSASHEAPDLYNYDLGWTRAEKVRQALLEIFPDATIDIATKGERPDIRRVEVYYGASCADVPVKYHKKAAGGLILCDSVVFGVTPQTVVMTIDLAQNNFKLKPGETVRAHNRSKNHRFGHENDVIAVGESTDDGKLIFRFPNLARNTSGFTERIWFSTSENVWFVPCTRYLEPDSKGHLAIQLTIKPNSVEQLTADDFLDQVARSGKPSEVYFEKERAYFKKN